MNILEYKSGHHSTTYINIFHHAWYKIHIFLLYDQNPISPISSLHNSLPYYIPPTSVCYINTNMVSSFSSSWASSHKMFSLGMVTYPLQMTDSFSFGSQLTKPLAQECLPCPPIWSWSLLFFNTGLYSFCCTYMLIWNYSLVYLLCTPLG